MKKFMMIAVMAVAALTASAQEVGSFFVTPKAGINLATITDTDNSKMRVGFVIGAEGGYQVSEEFAVTAGVLYSQQGVKGDVENGSLTFKNDYLNIPVLANYMLAPGLTVKLGLQPGFLLSAKIKAEKDGNSAEVDDKDSYNKFDLAMPIGLSYEYNKIVLDARYNLGLTKCFKEIDGESIKGRNSVFQITLGYKF